MAQLEFKCSPDQRHQFALRAPSGNPRGQTGAKFLYRQKAGRTPYPVRPACLLWLG